MDNSFRSTGSMGLKKANPDDCIPYKYTVILVIKRTGQTPASYSDTRQCFSDEVQKRE
jgi:hypothetical protein